MTWTRDDVLREAQEWVWAPPGTEHVRTPWCHALRAAASDRLTLAWVDLDTTAQDAWLKITELATAQQCRAVSVTLPEEGRPQGLEQFLLARGADLQISHQVMGWDLTLGQPGVEFPASIEAAVIESIDQWREAMIVSREVWGGDEPSATQQSEQAAALARPIRDRGGFQVLARHDGQPAATAGVTLAGPVARLWGACTVPAHRGQGAYRATVGRRLEVAARHGATLGLTNAKDDTSAPILARLGATRFGATRTYSCAVD